MKALSFKKLAFVCALALGLIVFWAAAVPSEETGHSILGAYHPTDPGGCCLDDHGGWCTLAAHPSTPEDPGSLGCNSPSDLVWCEGGLDDPSYTCQTYGTPPCVWTGDPWYCNNTLSMECVL